MNNNAQKIWLGTCAFLVIIMIFVGGWTRLSGSGLSIVEWKPITGIVPPLNPQAWEMEFASYKTSPEFQKINSDFSLEDFKGIFWLEYIHRILGRIIGLVIILPAILLGARKRTRVTMTILVVLQGLMGWYMVKSGLVSDPHVSHYRLAAHLSLAIVLYSVILWEIFTLSVQRTPDKLISNTGAVFLGLVYIQIVLGALVAGLHGGLIYNEFPLMDGRLIPAEFSMTLATFDNGASMQFIHRCVAYIATLASMVVSYKLWSRQRGLAKALLAATLTQVILGIITLLHAVPLNLALAHQLFAVLLLSIILYITFKFK